MMEPEYLPPSLAMLLNVSNHDDTTTSISVVNNEDASTSISVVKTVSEAVNPLSVTTLTTATTALLAPVTTPPQGGGRDQCSSPCSSPSTESSSSRDSVSPETSSVRSARTGRLDSGYDSSSSSSCRSSSGGSDNSWSNKRRPTYKRNRDSSDSGSMRSDSCGECVEDEDSGPRRKKLILTTTTTTTTTTTVKPRKRKRAVHMDWSERKKKKEEALNRFKNGEFASLHAAWAAVCQPMVSWSAFSRFVNNPAVGSRTGPISLLGDDGEAILVKWINDNTALGFVPTKPQILTAAGKLMFERHPTKWKENKPAGRKWYRLFLTRNPGVTLRRGRRAVERDFLPIEAPSLMQQSFDEDNSESGAVVTTVSSSKSSSKDVRWGNTAMKVSSRETTTEHNHCQSSSSAVLQKHGELHAEAAASALPPTETLGPLPPSTVSVSWTDGDVVAYRAVAVAKAAPQQCSETPSSSPSAVALVEAAQMVMALSTASNQESGQEERRIKKPRHLYTLA